VLAHGAARDPRELVHGFLGRAPNAAALIAEVCP
jgi:Zn-dependent oligopeptidase